MEDKQQAANNMYDDIDNDFEFIAKFALSPNIKDFTHLDKNILTTNLSARLKEPERLRIILNILHIIEKYKVSKKEMQVVDYEEREIKNEETGEVFVQRIPIVEEVEVFVPKYPKAHHYYLQKYRNFILTSASRNGYLLKELQTKKFKQEQSLEDKTNPSHRWNFIPRKKSSNNSMEDY